MTLEELETTPVGGLVIQQGPDGPNVAVRRNGFWFVTSDEQKWSSRDLLVTWGDGWELLRTVR